MTATTRRPGAGAVLIVPVLGLLWGGNWPAVRLCLDEMPPWTLRACGLSFAAVALLLIALARGRSLRVPTAHWPRVVLFGMLSIGFFNVLLAFAQLGGSTSRAAIVTFTMPIWATILARIVLGEPFDRRRIIGLSLGCAGLLGLGWPLVAAGHFPIGLIFAGAGGFCWALGTVLIKRWPIIAEPLAVAFWQLVVGSAFAGTGMLVFEHPTFPHDLTTYLAFAWHVLSQGLGYFLWFEVVAHVPAGIASLGLLTVPAVGVLGAMTVLGERPTLADGIGLVLIVAASASVLLPQKSRKS